MRLPKIDNKTFYLIGKWAFFVMAIMSLAGWIDSLGVSTGMAIVKGFASIVFNFALFGWFSWMANQQANAPDLTDEEIKALSGYISPTPIEKEVKK